MVTTNFRESFVREKASEEDVDISLKEGEVTVESDGVDMTGMYSPTEFEETVASVFGLNIGEAINLSEKHEEFGGRRAVTDSSLRTVEKYQESYGREKMSALADNLRVPDRETSAGNDIWNFLKTPEADILAENAEEEIDRILEADSNALEQQIDEELDDEYQEAAEQAYQNLEDDISEVAGLAEISGREPELGLFDTFKWLKDKQHNPNWNEEIDTEEVTERLRAEVHSQRRSKTLDALESQAHKVAAEHYKTITGEQAEEIDKDTLYGIRAHMLTEKSEDLELLEDIIKHDRDVYFQESSPSYDKLGSLENPEFEALREGLGRETYEIGDREVEIYVASPLEALRYGDEFDTCHSITWEEDFNTQNSGAINRSGNLTSPVIFVEDENGNIVGRDRMYTDEDEIMNKPVDALKDGEKSYTSLEDYELNSELRDAIGDYQEEMRLKMGYVKNEDRRDIADAIMKTKYEEEWHAPEHV